MVQLGSVGDCCPKPACECYGDMEAKTMIRYGQTKAGRQRYQCKACQKTFNEGKGTMCYNRKTDEQDMIECLALLAEGTRISRLSRAKGFKEDTILSF